MVILLRVGSLMGKLFKLEVRCLSCIVHIYVDAMISIINSETLASGQDMWYWILII